MTAGWCVRVSVFDDLVTTPSKAPTSWWTEPGTRQAFMDRAKQEQQTRMQFATVTGITRNPIGY